MKTIKELIEQSSLFLEEKGIMEPCRQAEDVISDSLGIPRLQLYLQFDRPLTAAEFEQCREKVERRAQGEPTQYIHGEVPFLDSTIKVNADVIIPRPETEILTDKIIQHLSKQNLKDKTLWDLCCGSGCMGIAIKKRFPELNVTLADVSDKALDIARENAKRNEVEVSFLQGDLLEPYNGQRAHYIVCNPPYISEKEYEELSSEVRDYEPKTALLAGKTGLEFYERLTSEFPAYLHPSAKVWFEIGHNQGAAVTQLFLGPPWKSCHLEKDWAGHDRFFSLEIE